MKNIQIALFFFIFMLSFSLLFIIPLVRMKKQGYHKKIHK